MKLLLCRSHVLPVRDDESETQRKAHAKLVRQTRRSTQGVTLEDLKSAEKLVKSRNQEHTQQFQVSLSDVAYMLYGLFEIAGEIFCFVPLST